MFPDFVKPKRNDFSQTCQEQSGRLRFQFALCTLDDLRYNGCDMIYLLIIPLITLFVVINLIIGCYVMIRLGYGPPNWQTALNLIVRLTTLQDCLNGARDWLEQKAPWADKFLERLHVPKPIVIVDTTPVEEDEEEEEPVEEHADEEASNEEASNGEVADVPVEEHPSCNPVVAELLQQQGHITDKESDDKA